MYEHSGIGTYLANLLPEITSKINSTIICGKSLHLGREKIIKAPIYSLKEQVALSALLYRSKYSLFWSPHFNLPLLNFKRQVTTVHDVFHLANPQYVKGLHQKLYARLFFEAVKYKSKKIICVSEFTKKELIKYTGCQENKISVIYNGVAEDWFNVPDAKCVHSKPYILYVGNVKPHKNLAGLLKAFWKIKEKTACDLIIAGKKTGFITGDQEVLRQAQNDKRVFLTGCVSKEQLKQYYKQAQLLVLPSFYEGFGLPALEAMACGTVVAVSDCASLPEVCGKAAFYFNPYLVDEIAETILNILADSTAKKIKIMQGIERAKAFTWTKSQEQTMAVLGEFL